MCFLDTTQLSSDKMEYAALNSNGNPKIEKETDKALWHGWELLYGRNLAKSIAYAYSISIHPLNDNRRRVRGDMDSPKKLNIIYSGRYAMKMTLYPKFNTHTMITNPKRFDSNFNRTNQDKIFHRKSVAFVRPVLFQRWFHVLSRLESHLIA